jgi:hypothetical protein
VFEQNTLHWAASLLVGPFAQAAVPGRNNNFCSQTACADGGNPVSAPFQATNGKFYGTTPGHGANNDGVVYSLGAGLQPFVATLPTSGKVGAAVKILGSNLTGATSVTFKRYGSHVHRGFEDRD